MKSFLRSIFLTIFLLLFSGIASADEGWEITNFDANIRIQEDGKVRVEEHISVDFHDLQKHGIFRDIPYAYVSPDGSKVFTEISAQSVTRNGMSEPYEVILNDANIRIQIGDANTLISGTQEYTIEYLATGILRSFGTYDELYLNVTGLEWPVTILKSSAEVHLPETNVMDSEPCGGDIECFRLISHPAPKILQKNCFLGVQGSREKCKITEKNSQNITFTSQRRLETGEGMTIAVGYTPNTIPILIASPPKTFGDILFSPVTFGFAGIIFLLGAFFVLRLWWKHGRDSYFQRKNLHDPNASQGVMPVLEHENIVVEYEAPEKLRPAEIGVIMDEKADTLDVSATIVDLAVRGYLTIMEKAKDSFFGSSDYILKRTEKGEDGLLEYEQKLLKSIFKIEKEILLSSLKNTFSQDLREVKNELYREITEKGFFGENPESVRLRYFLWAFFVLIFGVGLIILAANILSEIALGIGIGLVGFGVLFLIFSRFMPRRTAEGREIYRKARGYEVFLNNVEKHRQIFFEKQNVFMDVLPYAIVFGTTKKLSDAMAIIGVQPRAPSWYIGTHPFLISEFGAQVHNFSHTISTTMSSTPSGSGSSGGSSGGGFGGGGGGSW
ncbi:DUF2207 domain-containing protein [Candidatus Peregrinibacteria bacterium]|nr:DUF2207 domain-containing protein [Candidatus Peregrinibacteria bacterium]